MAKLKDTFRFLAWLSPLMLATACGGGLNFSQKANKQEKSSSVPKDPQGSSGDSESDNGEESENTATDQPSMVAGAFLTCAYLTAPGAAEDPQAARIGCGLYNGANKVDLTNKSYKLQLFAPDQSEVAMVTDPAQPSSRWHIRAKLPNDHRTDASVLRFSVGDQNETYDLPVTRISGYQQSYGSSAQGSGPEFALTQVSAPYQWNGSAISAFDWVGSAIQPKRFCLAGSVYKGKDPSTMLGDVVGSVIGSLTPGGQKVTMLPSKPIENDNKAFALNDSACFKDFAVSENFNKSGKNLAHEGDGCLFLRGGDDTLYIIPAATVADDKNLTLENLRTFAQQKRCH